MRQQKAESFAYRREVSVPILGPRERTATTSLNYALTEEANAYLMSKRVKNNFEEAESQNLKICNGPLSFQLPWLDTKHTIALIDISYRTCTRGYSGFI